MKCQKQLLPRTVAHMSSLKDLNVVGELPLEALIMACSFFTNRLFKEYILFKQSVFLMSELNFSAENILKNNMVVPEELFSVLVKYAFW